MGSAAIANLAIVIPLGRMLKMTPGTKRIASTIAKASFGRPGALVSHGALACLEGWPDRTALYFRPAGRVNAVAVELHGSGHDPLRQYRLSKLADLLLPHGIAILLPQAATPTKLMPRVAAGFVWNVPGAPLPGATQAAAAGADDVGYVTGLVEAVQAELGLREAPLFLAGYSGGGRFASSLLTSGDLAWTAAGLVAGLRAVEMPRRRPPPTISFHGVEDAINPFAGGLGLRWDVGVEEAGRRY